MTLAVVSSLSLICFMLGLGCDLGNRDFAPLMTEPKSIALGAAAQMIGLPVLGLILTFFAPFSVETKMGIMIIACCPGGPSANMFSWLARADLALCVTLTALTSILCVFTIPIVLNFVGSALSVPQLEINIDVFAVMTRLFSLSLLPMGIGMLVRALRPALATLLSRPLKIIGIGQLVLLIFMVIFANYEKVGKMPLIEFAAIVGLVIGGMTLAKCIAVVGKLSLVQQRSIQIEVGIQNAVQGIAIATMIPGLDSGRTALPSIVFALAMYPVVGLYVWSVRRKYFAL